MTRKDKVAFEGYLRARVAWPDRDDPAPLVEDLQEVSLWGRFTLRQAEVLSVSAPNVTTEISMNEVHSSPTCKTARKASWGISTLPTCFIRRLPAFCLSRSLRLRVISPP